MSRSLPKVLIAFNQPTGGIYKTYDGRSNKIKQEHAIDLSEVGVIEEFEEIKTSLCDLGFEVSNLNILNDIELMIDEIKRLNPDVIFNLVESIEGESVKEMYVAGIYELLEVPYTGCDPFTLGLCLHKNRTKLFLLANAINTPKWNLYLTPKEKIFDGKLNFPVIVKPSREDASVGISEESVIYDSSSLKNRVEFVFENFKQPILVEEFIEGREINAGVLGDKQKVPLPLSEIDFSTLPEGLPGIVTYDGKWIKDSLYYKSTIPICPAPLDNQTTERIQKLALFTSQIFGCRDYCRVDIRLNKENIPYVIEVNPNPDISKDAGFPRAAKAYGLNYEELLITIINFALERGKR
ncbi:MAG: ATP-grasp domain-containing protein [Ignavibacteria bacterium]|nr:ATP-grasp domain-containing protein [Ignavibacteria bacterium]